MQLPYMRLDQVYHVGSMNKDDKGDLGNSLEGNGLSVSLHPLEWQEIARLSGPVHTLTRPGGTFLNYHDFSAPNREAVAQWGNAQRLISLQTRFRAEWLDSETAEKVFTFFKNQKDAKAEIEDIPEATLESVPLWCGTEELSRRIGFAPDDSSAFEMAACAWVEDCTELDGVWWDDNLDVSGLSAPRGVINLKSLPRWNVFMGAST